MTFETHSAATDRPSSALPPSETFFPQLAYRPGSPLCFVHIAKAAGTTVRLVMENAFSGDRTFPSGSRAYEGRYLSLTNGLEAGDDPKCFDALSGHLGARISEFLEPHANLFTWLREPGDRAISHFFFVVQQERRAAHQSYIDRLERGERIETIFLDWLDRPTGYRPLQDYMVFGTASDYPSWRKEHPGARLTDAAIEALRRCFFIGLLEDQERSLDAFCALTSILPPKAATRRNAGRDRPKRLTFTADEQARYQRLLAPEAAFYSLVKSIYARQMIAIAELARTQPALAFVGNREALRAHILGKVASRTPVLTKWNAWDPILGENLDGREQFKAPDGAVSRWRWTAPGRDTFLYFRLPKGIGFDLTIRLNPATPLRHAERATLRVDHEALPLVLTRTPDGCIDLVATMTREMGDRLPALVELHLHTPEMIDEGTRVPYAGARLLGLAIESISATPFGTSGNSGTDRAAIA